MNKNKICSIALTLCLGVTVLNGYTCPANVATAKERKDNYIIMTENQDSIQEIKEKCEEDYQTEIVETCSEHGDAYSENHMVCELSDSDAEELAEVKDVIVEKDEIIQACATDTDGEKDLDAEWNIQMVRADEGTKVETGDKKIKVAVLDSGVDDFNDLQLAGSIDLIPGEEEVLPLFWDVTGHGSSVAGIIAAEKNDVGITGIAPETEIYAAKVLDEKNQAPVSRVIDGIYWAIENKVNIINMSFGLKNNSLALHKAIRDAYDAGILLVAAAGNGDSVEYPAAYDEVIAVGSVDTSGTVSEQSASGNELELAAPGEQICSTGAFEGTLVSAGTSMAAPHVTGIAARLWAKDTSVSAEFIRQLMAASANECGEKDSYGNGLVDLAYAEEIYDMFKQNYVEGDVLEHHSGIIPDNGADIDGYEVDYVEGRWYGEDHENAISNSSLNSTQIAILKTGAIYPDKKGSVYVGMHDNPEWHGYYTINYISAYIYITRIATTIGKGKGVSEASIPSGISALKSSNIISDIIALPFNTILTTPNAANKKLLIWGMAIHSATDVFAHSTYGRFNGVWKLLDHSNTIAGLADKISDDAFPERYRTAVKVAKNSLTTYINGSAGTVSDFLPVDAYKSAGITWAVKDLYRYANVFDSNVANALKSYSG